MQCVIHCGQASKFTGALLNLLGVPMSDLVLEESASVSHVVQHWVPQWNPLKGPNIRSGLFLSYSVPVPNVNHGYIEGALLTKPVGPSPRPCWSGTSPLLPGLRCRYYYFAGSMSCRATLLYVYRSTGRILQSRRTCSTISWCLGAHTASTDRTHTTYLTPSRSTSSTLAGEPSC